MRRDQQVGAIVVVVVFVFRQTRLAIEGSTS